MPALVDIHVHLLAALDDGPRTPDDALAMCRIAVEEGIGYAASLSHQSDRWRVSPQTIRDATKQLQEVLARENVPLEVFPSAEVMASPEMVGEWEAGGLLSLGDRRQFLLVEMPHGIYVDLRPAMRQLGPRGVRVVLAHAERHPEMLHQAGVLEDLIQHGALVQVNSASITDPASPADGKAIRSWFERGCVHFLGSDGHSLRKRRPHMAAAYRQVCEWAGPEAAERVGTTNGLALLRGQPFLVPTPKPVRRWWPPRLW